MEEFLNESDQVGDCLAACFRLSQETLCLELLQTMMYSGVYVD